MIEAINVDFAQSNLHTRIITIAPGCYRGEAALPLICIRVIHNYCTTPTESFTARYTSYKKVFLLIF